MAIKHSQPQSMGALTHFVTESDTSLLSSTHAPGVLPLHDYDYKGNFDGCEEQEQRFPCPYHESEDVELNYGDNEEDYISCDEDCEIEGEDGDVEDLPSDLRTDQQRRQPPTRANSSKVEGVVSPQCPSVFLTTEGSFSAPSYTSSSTVPFTSTSSMDILSPNQVTCQRIPSQLQDYSLAFCISNEDCSRGFIQIVRRNGAVDPSLRFKVSEDPGHDRHFRQVAGPDDFYFVIEGAQKLALGAHLVPSDLLVKVDGNSTSSSTDSQDLIYRADFRMTLPGPVQLSGWLRYEKFRAVRENRPGVWPQWTHSVLINPKTTVDLANIEFNICSNCELDSFLDQVKTYREEHFEQCDRMAPVRGSYWKEDLALRVYSKLDTINTEPGAGFFLEDKDEKLVKSLNKDDENYTRAPKLTRGWRFVPSGCTMTKTSSLPNASSQDPYIPTCDSVESPGAAMRAPLSQRSNEAIAENKYPRRRILFTGDSQVRTTYNAILSHYRPLDPVHQQFGFHDEFLPGSETLNLNHTITMKPTSASVIRRKETDTEIELIYKADQFLDFLVTSTDKELDVYDTIYLNLGQWPASGPVAGGQWATATLLERWEAVIKRLNRWKLSREEQIKTRSPRPGGAKGSPTAGTGDSSIVIWAGMNAFPMRTDPSIQVKGDWRTNARLGYWDDWIETISQEAGGWFRRMNAWQLTFPMLDQVVDRAHFQQTDAIDALKIEALYKLDLCSRMRPDTPYSSPLADTITSTTITTTTTA
ncbi:hypothetical protein BGZ80_001858 [Entomortierella chlamydospora]|uniref:Uncharacterized protein n=1 Tax=Entomortierella chlamydospora TaxID=101097 RepID=A0A9P6MQW8_9FUNG|nr:hypothetical protein BGZ80_001858 [Entomortierella chlamydospora]